MNALSKGILWTVGALLALVIAGFVGLNIYLKSPGTQAQIREAVGNALGTPIEITSTSVTPWSDLRINGIRMPAASGSGSPPIGAAPSFTARYRLLPLFSKKLVVTAMTLESPTIAWRQNAEGRWTWPPEETARLEERVKKKKKRKGEQLEGESESGFQVLIDGLKVHHGTIDLQDASGTGVATATGVDLDFSRLAAHDISGTMRLEKVVWGPLVFEKVSSPFNITEEAFELRELAAELAGGEVKGSLKVENEIPEAPLTANLTLSRVNLAKIAAEAGWSEGSVSGAVSGNFNLRGPSGQLALAEGRGHLELERGQFRQNELLQTIGEVLAIDEFANLRLSSATAEIRMADEKVFAEPLTLATANLRVTAKGYVRFDKKVSLDARLAVTEDISKRIPGFIRDSFSAADTEAMRSIDFKVTGRTDKPKTDLAEQLVGRKVGEQVQDLLNGLFGSKKKKEEKTEEPKEEKKGDKKKKKKSEKPAESEPSIPPDSSASVLEPPAAPVPPLPPPPAPAESAPGDDAAPPAKP